VQEAELASAQLQEQLTQKGADLSGANEERASLQQQLAQKGSDLDAAEQELTHLRQARQDFIEASGANRMPFTCHLSTTVSGSYGML